jgi:activator of HSP90 ATPase
MRTKVIKQSVTLPAEPHEVYEAYMDSKKHAAFTGDAARMSRRKGARFTAGSGYIDGRNVELVPDERIVQTWRGSDWPEGHYSELTITLKRVKGGTRLDFLQKDVPEDQYGPISEGWHEFYWEPLKEWLAARKKV